MKTYRVTLKCIINSRPAFLSATVPAYNNEQAIEKVTEANNLVGQVSESKAEEVK